MSECDVYCVGQSQGCLLYWCVGMPKQDFFPLRYRWETELSIRHSTVCFIFFVVVVMDHMFGTLILPVWNMTPSLVYKRSIEQYTSSDFTALPILQYRVSVGLLLYRKHTSADWIRLVLWAHAPQHSGMTAVAVANMAPALLPDSKNTTAAISRWSEECKYTAMLKKCLHYTAE